MIKLKKLFTFAIFLILALNGFAQNSQKSNSDYIEKFQKSNASKTNVHLILTDNAEIKEAIEKKIIDVNYKYEKGLSLLFSALVEYNYEPENFLKVAQFLIKNGADVNLTDDSGDSPLLYAVSHISSKRDLRNIEFLLKNNANVKVQKNNGITILYALCSTKEADLNLIKTFIKKGAPINTASNNGFTPLTFALYHKNAELAKLLIENGANANQADEDGNYPLLGACKIGDLSLVKLMISKGAKINVSDKDSYTPLHFAADSNSKDSFEIVKLLVEKGANVNAASSAGYTPLILAGWNNSKGFEIIKYLVGKKADINAKTDDGYNVGMAISWLLNPDCFKFLADNGFNFKAVNKSGENTLHKFVKDITCSNGEDLLNYYPILESHEKISEIISLLASKTDINATTKNKETVLHQACCSVIDYTGILDALIKNGANVNALNDYKRSPIFFCLRHPKMVQLLIDSGANLSIKDKNGKTCFDICEEMIKYNPEISETIEILKAHSNDKKNYTFVQLAEYNYFDKAVEMLKKGNVKGLDDFDETGYTPLYYAVFNKNLELTKLLLDKGCDINKRQKKDNTTVLYYAVDKLNLEMVKLLLKYKPDLSMLYKPDYLSSNANILSKSIYKNKGYDVTKLLLEAGADPNGIIDDEEKISLTVSCCLNGPKETAELLIEYGGNPFATWKSWTYYGTTIYSIINHQLDYSKKNAIYRGLVKQFKDKVFVATENLRIRDYYTQSSRTLTTMKKGTKVKIIDASQMEIIDDIHSCWVKVEILPGSVDKEDKKIPKGITGWCYLGYLEMEK